MERIIASGRACVGFKGYLNSSPEEIAAIGDNFFVEVEVYGSLTLLIGNFCGGSFCLCFYRCFCSGRFCLCLCSSLVSCFWLCVLRILLSFIFFCFSCLFVCLLCLLSFIYFCLSCLLLSTFRKYLCLLLFFMLSFKVFFPHNLEILEGGYSLPVEAWGRIKNHIFGTLVSFEAF